jgi:hypothetical protein
MPNKIHETITEETWCQKWFFAGLRLDLLNPYHSQIRTVQECILEAPRLCLTGWIHRTYPDTMEQDSIKRRVSQALRDRGWDPECPIVSFNDSTTTHFVHVLSLVQELDI